MQNLALVQGPKLEPRISCVGGLGVIRVRLRVALIVRGENYMQFKGPSPVAIAAP